MVEIKKVVTAIGNSKLNDELKNENLDIACGDILYREGILEFLEEDKNIDYIIINEDIPGDIPLVNLLEEIKKENNKIKIILISQNDFSENHKEIYKNIYKKIENIDKNLILSLIFKNDNIYSKPTMPLNDFFYMQTKEGEIISILGPNGVGKSVFSVTLANNIVNKRILIVDFDAFNESIYNLLGIRKEKNDLEKIQNKNNFNSQKNTNESKNNLINNKNVNSNKNKKSYKNLHITEKKLYEDYDSNEIEEFNINQYIIKSKNNIDLLSGINAIFNLKQQITTQKFISFLNNFKKEYDYIIVDTASNYLVDYTKEIAGISDRIIFISGSNLLEVKKTKQLLNIYIDEWEIPKEKIKLIFNKWSKNSIDDGVLRELFSSYEILGKIKLSDYYDLAINRKDIKNKQIEKNIKYIRRKIVRKR